MLTFNILLCLNYSYNCVYIDLLCKHNNLYFHILIAVKVYFDYKGTHKRLKAKTFAFLCTISVQII